MPELLGKYRLLKRLAVGGMAEIWLARQEGVHGFEKMLVVKRILPHLAEHPEFVQMFLDEARLAAQLTHQNIVQIFDLGEEAGAYFIAMEHIHGENLRVVARRLAERGDGRLAPYLAARVIAQSAEALHYAHARKTLGGEPLNIVHRDISPQNIILGYDGVAKVVDFGIAKAASQFAETRTGILKGKYAYMSPEQTLGKTLDGRSDVFALGVVFWELVTGHRLFSRNSDLLILKAISDEPPPPPRTIVPDLPEAIDAVILKALAKDRDDRFESAAELHETLEQVLHSSGELVNNRTLATFMSEIFPDRIKAWEQLFSSAQAAEIDLESPAFEERSDLLEAGTPSASQLSSPRKNASSPGAAAPKVDTEGATRLSTGEEARALSVAAPPSGLLDQVKKHPLSFGGMAFVVVAGIAIAGVALMDKGSGTAPDTSQEAGGEALNGIRLPVTLELQTTPPGATVEVNGVALSTKTPISTQLDPTGEPVTVLISLAGHIPVERKAKLDAGARIAWEILLQKKSARPLPPAAPARPVPAKPPETVAAPPKGPTPDQGSRSPPAAHPPRRPRMATLTFDARPWCRLSIDGKDQGVTPFSRLPVTAGRHKMVCKHPSLGTRTLSLRFRAGKEIRKVVTLGTGTLKVMVKPWAKVVLDGKNLGETPFPPVKIDAGEHKVVLINEALKVRRTKTITIAPGRTFTISEDLR